MLHAKAKWNIPAVDEEAVQLLAGQLNIPPLLARLLAVRGWTKVEEAGRFLYAKEDQFHDPFLLDGMEPAVLRIRQALEQGEKIRIYGDYDADGVSSTSLMIGLMKSLGADFDYYIPHRQTEGYGLNRPALEAAKRLGITLVITVDTGISAVEEAQAAKELGIDLIVTDHHEPPAVLPEAYAIINPRKPACPYPFKSLAGVGVAFKLAHALLGRIPYEWLEYAAIGTVADLMPLVDENRLLVKLGLERIRSTSMVGIRALLGVAGIDRHEVTAGHIGFSIGPRINASGRLERADTAVICLTTDNEQEAEHLAFDLDRLNRERQQIVEQIVEEALVQAEKLEQNGLLDKVLVLYGEGWNVGIVGIVASKVLEKYYRPTIILGIDRETGMAKGSARSIPGFDLHAALTECDSVLDHYGGHQAAAGMSLHRDRLPEFHRMLNDYADRVLTDEHFIPVYKPDMEISADVISPEMIEQLDLLGPFGMKNPTPSFILRGLRLKELKLLGKDRQHIKLLLTPGNGDSPVLEAIAFGKAEWASSISSTGKIDLFGELSINEWNGIKRPQLMIKDLSIGERQIFDWRGKTNLDEAFALWYKTSTGSSRERGILLFGNDPALLLAEEQRAAVWAVGPDLQLLAVNEQATRTVPSEIKNVFIPILPPELAAVESGIACFPQAERIYAVLQDRKPFLSGTMPSRDQFKQVYAMLASMKGTIPVTETMRRISGKTQLTSDVIRFILAVFDELGFIERAGDSLGLVPSPPKKDLSEACIYKEKLAREEVERVFIYSTAIELKDWFAERLEQQVYPYSANA